MAATKITLREWLKKEDYTLALSSGFFGFFAHCGVALALYEDGIRPSKFTGSSAGAIISAALSHGLDPKEIRETLKSIRKEDFWDPGLGAGLLKGHKAESLLREMIGETPETATPLSISVFDIYSRRTRSFSRGDIPRLVRASISVPLMFHPVTIEGRLYCDGGIMDKMALHDVRDDERVLVHYLTGNDPISRFERRRDQLRLKEARKNQIALIIENLPAMGPNRMAQGGDVIEKAYEATQAALNREMTTETGWCRYRAVTF